MRAMKDSGIAWIGEIPTDWTKTRIGNLFRFSSGDSLTNEEIQDEGLYKVYGANGPRGYYHHSNLAGKHILIGRVGALCGNVHVVNEAVWATEHALIAEQISSDIYTDFAARVFESMSLGQYSKASAQPVIASSVVQRLQIPIPPFSEQHRIADYLDRKCSQIDAIIARQQEVIEKLKAYKLSVITEAVTKGLNPHAPMKDSGVEWIGEIPEHWEIRKLKSIVDIISKGTTPSTIGSELRSCGEIRFLKAENIQNNRVVLEPEFYIDKETHSILKRSQLQENDILFVIAGATIGKTAILSGDAIPANTNQAVSFIRLKEKDDSKYVWYYLQSCYVKTILNQLSVQSAQPNLSMEDMGNFYLCYPPKKERNLIAEKLDNRCTEIDGIIYNKENLVLKLTGYKKSLIYEVITGKKEV